MISGLVRPAAAAAAVALAGANAATASSILGRNLAGVSLSANTRGEALVTYTQGNGRPRHVLVWGAVNARPPDANMPQVAFRTDYSGGWKKYRRIVWKSFRNTCRPYDGPSLVYVVTACRAPDGSYWAV